MAIEYRVYVKIKTNIEVSQLKYQLKILNTSTQKIINTPGFSIDHKTKYSFTKSGSNYRTSFVKLIYKAVPTETLKDLVIVFDLFRVDANGKEHHVIRNYEVNNMVEEFELSKYQSAKLDIVEYLEKNDPTKEVVPTNSNTVQLPITSKKIFICKDLPANKEDPFSKESVEASLFARLKEPYPDQSNTNLCGPAAFFYCVLTSNKNVYKKIVKSLWERGEVSHNRLNIKPNVHGARTVSHYFNSRGDARISPVDWITMGSLRDTANTLTDYNRASGDGYVSDFINGITAFTMPDEVKNWFSQIGYNIPVYHSFIRQKVPRTVDWLNELKELYKYPAKDHYYVLLTVGAVTMNGGNLPKYSTFPSHYIVLNSELKVKSGIVNNTTNESEPVYASCFNWGKQDSLKKITLKDLSRFVWAIIVVKRELN